MAPDPFEELAQTYRLDLEEKQYRDEPVVGVSFDRYYIGCRRERTLLGDHKVVYMDGIEQLDPSIGEFADEYARAVIRDMGRFTDIDRYLSRHGVMLEGVNDDLYSRIRGRAETLLRP